MLQKRKKCNIALFTGFLVLLAVLVSYCCVRSNAPRNGTSEADIAVFLSTYGWETGIKAENVEEVTVPTEFGEVYQQYNELQISQGYDLTKYRGEKVTKYTFSVGNFGIEGKISSNAEAHVLVFDGRIIGGDVCSTDLGGFMCGFEK